MTMTLDRPRSSVTEATPTVRWHPHQAGVWVAYRADQFVGMVEELWRRGFTATTGLGRRLGHFSTLHEAKAALEDAVAVE